jgi:hypothetical protein
LEKFNSQKLIHVFEPSKVSIGLKMSRVVIALHVARNLLTNTESSRLQLFVGNKEVEVDNHVHVVVCSAIVQGKDLTPVRGGIGKALHIYAFTRKKILNFKLSRDAGVVELQLPITNDKFSYQFFAIEHAVRISTYVGHDVADPVEHCGRRNILLIQFWVRVSNGGLLSTHAHTEIIISLIVRQKTQKIYPT